MRNAYRGLYFGPLLLRSFFFPRVSEVEHLKKNLEAMKKQAEATNKEYDRLTDEHSHLQVYRQAFDGNFDELLLDYSFI